MFTWFSTGLHNRRIPLSRRPHWTTLVGMVLGSLVVIGALCTAHLVVRHLLLQQLGQNFDTPPASEFEHPVMSLDYSPCDDTIVAIQDSRKIVIWRNGDLRQSTTVDVGCRLIGNLRLSPDGATVVAWKVDDKINLYSVKTARLLQSIEQPNVSSVVFGDDGKALFAVGGHHLRIWDSSTGALIREIRYDARLTTVAYVRGSRQLICGCADGRVMFQDIDFAEQPKFVDAHAECVMEMSIDRVGRRMVTVGWEQSICFWDVSSRRMEKRIHGHEDRINAAATSDDGSFVATGGEDSTVIVWDPATGARVNELHQESIVNSLVFARDGRLLVGTYNNRISTWDVGTGRQLR